MPKFQVGVEFAVGVVAEDMEQASDLVVEQYINRQINFSSIVPVVRDCVKEVEE